MQTTNKPPHNVRGAYLSIGEVGGKHRQSDEPRASGLVSKSGVPFGVNQSRLIGYSWRVLFSVTSGHPLTGKGKCPLFRPSVLAS